MATIVSLQGLTGSKFVTASRFIDKAEITEGWTHRRNGDDDHDIEVSFAREEDAAALRDITRQPDKEVVLESAQQVEQFVQSLRKIDGPFYILVLESSKRPIRLRTDCPVERAWQELTQNLQLVETVSRQLVQGGLRLGVVYEVPAPADVAA